MTDPSHDDAADRVPLRTRVIAGIVALAAVLLAGFGMLRVSSPRIVSGQTPPAGHYPLECPVCHTVADATETVNP